MNDMKPSTDPPRVKGKAMADLSTSNERCLKKIGEWVQHVISQVEMAGKEMKVKVVVLHKHLEELEEGGLTTFSKLENVPGEKINFVPNVLFDELKMTDLGFLAVDSVVPSDFHLDMVTMLPQVQVGNMVTCVLSCHKKVSTTVLSFLQYIVTHDNKPVTIKTDSTLLQFGFTLPYPGEFQVAALLYGHHVLGSPLLVPVADSALPGLAQLGLGPLGDVDAGGDVALNHEDMVESKPVVEDILVGYICVAKWSEDGVWYRARVEKVEGKMVEVTFMDYGNMELIARDSILKCREQIPCGEDIDEFVGEKEEELGKIINDVSGVLKLSIGVTVLAKWGEDDVWYNAEIIGHFSEGKTVEVSFVDYGNSAEVDICNILRTKVEIPTEDDIDENVLEVERIQSQQSAQECPLQFVKEISAIDSPLNCAELAVNSAAPATVACWPRGSACVAQWAEDCVWYNAVVDSVGVSGQYQVTFTDYSNTATVTSDRIVAIAQDIPADQLDMVDECVKLIITEKQVPIISSPVKIIDIDESSAPDLDPSPSQDSPAWSAGDSCLVCWAEDGVWYNAVLGSWEGGEYAVTFTDYGNQDTVTSDRIVAAADDIPADQMNMIDENVDCKLVVHCPVELSSSNSIPPLDPPAADSPSPEAKIAITHPWAVGSTVIAQWAEDHVWYNAVVDAIDEATGEIHVTFPDYGNTTTVTRDSIITSARDIPADQVDMIDECVQIPRIELADCKSSDIKLDENHVEDKYECEAPVTNSPEKTDTTNSPICVGSIVLACWSEDSVWYNAVVDGIDEATGDIHVTFTDYGNTTTVTSGSIVTSAGDIPVDQLEMVDESVVISTEETSVSDSHIQVVKEEKLEVKANAYMETSTELTQYSDNSAVTVGMVWSGLVWSEDNVWYNAVVDSIEDAAGKVEVTFTDYGNTAAVSVNDIVNNLNGIPAEELDSVDECVHQATVCVLSSALLTNIKNEESIDFSPDIQDHLPPSKHSWQVGDSCIARWAEDGVWYNTQVLEICGEECLVRFRDYGDEANVLSNDMVMKVEDIPIDDEMDDCVGLMVTETKTTDGLECDVSPSPLCSLCGEVCRQAVRLTCCPAMACRGCAVEEIISSRTCWQCGQKEISTETHTVQEDRLSTTVQSVAVEKNPEEVIKHVDEEKHDLNNHPTNLLAGDACIARWSEDECWYNAVIVEISVEGIVTVNFTDYGNSDQVKPVFVLTSAADLPPGAEVDHHVIVSSATLSEVHSSNAFLTMSTPGPDGVKKLEAKQIMCIKDLKGPVGVTVLGDKTVAVVCKGDNTVRRFSREGQFIGQIKGQRILVNPTNILLLLSGDFVVRDELGIQMFDEQSKFIRNLGNSFINRCHGLAQDELGRVITVNSNTGVGGYGKLTELGEADVFYIDIMTGAVVKRVELADIVGEKRNKSACRSLAYANKKLYIVDMGLDCVYVLFLKDGEEQADAVGSYGSDALQFRDPVGLVVDSDGTMMVVDSKNDRLQLVSKDYTICGLVKVDTPLSKPSGIFLDQDQGEIVVSSYADQTVRLYKI